MKNLSLLVLISFLALMFSCGGGESLKETADLEINNLISSQCQFYTNSKLAADETKTVTVFGKAYPCPQPPPPPPPDPFQTWFIGSFPGYFAASDANKEVYTLNGSTFLRDVLTGATTTLPLSVVDNGFQKGSFDIYGNKIVYWEGGSVKIFNLTTNTSSTLFNLSGHPPIAMWNNIVVFIDFSEPYPYKTKTYNLETGQTQVLITGKIVYDIDFDNNKLVYIEVVDELGTAKTQISVMDIVTGENRKISSTIPSCANIDCGYVKPTVYNGLVSINKVFEATYFYNWSTNTMHISPIPNGVVTGISQNMLTVHDSGYNDVYGYSFTW